MARKLKTVHVQKFLNGRPKNAPFGMEITRAQELVEAHKRSANGVYYEIIEKQEVAPVTPPAQEQKKTAVVTRAGVSELTGAGVVDWLGTKPSKKEIAVALSEERANKKRTSVINILNKAWNK